MLLDELERLLGAATGRPWKTENSKVLLRELFIVSESEYDIARLYQNADTAGDGSDNAALIVAAVNALPGLIKAVRAAQAYTDAVRPAPWANEDCTEELVALAAALTALESEASK